MIGLSPLSPGHRSGFQPTSVRPSTGSYPRFSLPRDSSPGFASAARDWIAQLRLAFASAPFRLTSPRASDSLAHSTKGTPSHPEGCSDCSWAHGFRYCFTPLPGCFSPFPHGTCALSVTWEYSGLDGGPPRFGPGFTCPALLRYRSAPAVGVRVRGSNPLRPAFPCRSAPWSRSPGPGRQSRGVRPYNPGGANAAARMRSPVWPYVPFRSPLLGESRD